MRKLPITTKIDDVDVKPVARQSLFSLYDQTIRILKREKNAERLVHFFSEPSVSKTDKVIRWHTLAQGEIRSWKDLGSEEQQKAAEQVKANCKRVQEVCQALTKVQGADSPIIEALQNMLVTPGIQDSLFLVGDEVVLTQWGCRPYGTAPADFNLDVQGQRAAQKFVPPVAVAAVNADLPVEAAPVVEAGVPEELVKPEEPKPEPLPPADPAPVEPPPEEPKPEEPPPEEKKPLLWRWLLLLLLLLLLILGLFLKKWTYIATYDTAAEDRYRSEISDLWLKIDDKAKTCTPVKPPTQSTLTPEALERKDMNVFDGSWKMITTLRNVANDEAIVIEYVFDGKGKGQSITREATGDVCTGTAELSIQSASRFSVDMSEQKCKMGKNFGKNYAECTVKKDMKTADCVLQCVEGKCDATFVRR